MIQISIIIAIRKVSGKKKSIAKRKGKDVHFANLAEPVETSQISLSYASFSYLWYLILRRKFQHNFYRIQEHPILSNLKAVYKSEEWVCKHVPMHKSLCVLWLVRLVYVQKTFPLSVPADLSASWSDIGRHRWLSIACILGRKLDEVIFYRIASLLQFYKKMSSEICASP